MKIRSSAALALVLGLGVALAGCGKMNEVRAMKAFKDGNKLYAAQDYREAVEKYEEAIQLDPEDNIKSCGASSGCVYFYLANSYDNLYRPTRRVNPTTTRIWRRRSRTTSSPRRKSPMIRRCAPLRCSISSRPMGQRS